MKEAADLTPLALGLLAAQVVALYATHLGIKALTIVIGLPRYRVGRHSRARRPA